MWTWLVACQDPATGTNKPDPNRPTWYRDADGDGFGDPFAAVDADDEPQGYVDNPNDCDDTRPDVNPDAVEVCAAGDEDCDGLMGDADPDVADALPYWEDADGDGFGAPGAPAGYACVPPPGFVNNDVDCDPLVRFGLDWENGLDDDCDGNVDLQGTRYASWLQIHPEGDALGDIISADLDGNGGADLYLTAYRYTPNALHELVGFHDVRLMPGVLFPDTHVWLGLTSVLTIGADYNGDNLPELVVSGAGEEWGAGIEVRTMPGTVRGALSDFAAFEGTVFSTEHPGKAADYDGDGRAEVPFTKVSDFTHVPPEGVVLIDTLPAGWTEVADLLADEPVLAGAQFGFPAELNGDGIADFVSAGRVWFGGPNIRISAPVLAETYGVFGDIDGDGLDDRAYCTLDGRTGVAIWFGRTFPAWDPAVPDAAIADACSPTHNPQLGDVDGDGYADVLSHTALGLTLFRGGPDFGVATPTPSWHLPGTVSNPRVGDYDGDGRADIAAHGADDLGRVGIFILAGSPIPLWTAGSMN